MTETLVPEVVIPDVVLDDAQIDEAVAFINDQQHICEDDQGRELFFLVNR